MPALAGSKAQKTFRFLEDEQKLLSSIFDILQECVLLVNEQGYISFYNKSAFQLLNLPQEGSAMMAPLWHWIPILENFFTQQDKTLLPDVFAKETELIYPEKRFIRVHVQRLHKGSNVGDQFVVLIEDITQEKTVNEERVFQGQCDSITQLASEVAHELGNPLNSIGIHLQLIQRALKKASGQKSALASLQVCQDEIHRLDEIIQHFLKAVRPKVIELKEGYVMPVLEHVVSVLKPQLESLNIKIQLDIAKNASSILMDSARLHQAFFNIIKNSIEAIGTQGWIHISCFQNEEQLVVAFADSGGGMNGEQAVHVFSEENSTSKPYGHGIGMLIIRRVMREHKGWIEMESKPGFGSIIYLKFPLPTQALRRL